MDTISIRAKNGSSVQFKNRLVQVSTFVSDIIEEYQTDQIPLNHIGQKTLEKIRQYCEVFNYVFEEEIPCPLIGTFRQSVGLDEYQFFQELDYLEVNKLLEAADLLGIERLSKACCAFIASQFKERHPDFLREKYQFPRQYSSMGEVVREWYDWLFYNQFMVVY